MRHPHPTRRDSIKTIAALGAASTLGSWSSLAQAQKPITIGAIYVGAKDDYGYNQAQAEAVAAVKKLPGVKAVEEENVPETAAVTKSMTGMITQDGASVLFPCPIPSCPQVSMNASSLMTKFRWRVDSR